LTSSGVAMSIGTTAGSAAYFDYTIANASLAMRAGTVIAVWDGTTAACTDYSTVDLNSSTAAFIFSVSISGSNLRLNYSISSGVWSVKIGTRVI